MPLSLLAASPSPSSTTAPIDPSRVTPGVLGFLSIVFLVVAVFFLWRSMNKQIRGIRFEGSVPVDPEPAGEPAEAATDEGAIAPGADGGTDDAAGGPAR